MPTYTIRAPNGRTYSVQGPAGASEAQVRAEVQRQHPDAVRAAEKPTSFWRGVIDEVGKAGSNAMWVMDALQGRNLASRITGQPTPAQISRVQVKNASARSPYQGSTAGKITGGILGSLPAAVIPGGALAQGAASGALLTENPDDIAGLARDAVIGGVIGKAGQLVGKRVAAPLAERVGRTKAARAVAQRVVNTANKVLPRKVPMLPLPRITKAERTVSRAAPQLADVRQKVQDAVDLKLPFSMADADPRLTQLGGSVARFSPDGRKLAEQNYIPRARGQADRAVNAIDQYLAPVTNIEQRAGDIRKEAQNVSRPFYDEARSRAAPVDEELASMLQAPAGKDALRRAYTIAQNEGRDPHAIGFDLDDQGEVILRDMPSFETLQLTKRGLDSNLDGFRNPITGKLDLEGNPEAQSIAGLLHRFNAKLGTLNEPYKQGNAAYAQQIARRDALHLGQDVSANNVPQRQFDAAMERQTPETLPELQRGYATSMADTVNKQRLSRNPYDAVYGSTDQQAKVGRLFPQGAPRFNRQYELEGTMGDTLAEVLKGSQTQGRNISDQLFQNDALNGVADAAIQATSGGGIPGGTKLLGMLAQKVKDRGQLGLLGAKAKADALAPGLFDTNNPQGLLDFIDNLVRKQAEEEARKAAYRKAGGLLGLPVAAGVVGAGR
jgi:hypothetical protein